MNTCDLNQNVYLFSCNSSMQVCPTNLADRHSLQFTINKIVYKIFGLCERLIHNEICVHFGIDSVENLVANWRNRFNVRILLMC